MRYMILVKATEESEAGVEPDEAVFEEMAAYHEELARAGVLLDASGLHPSSEGWRIRYEDGERTALDGPFAETKELLAGYTLIEVSSREEAREWARRFPAPTAPGVEGEIEVRRLMDLDDFGDGYDVNRFRALDLPSQQEARG